MEINQEDRMPKYSTRGDRGLGQGGESRGGVIRALGWELGGDGGSPPVCSPGAK